MIWLPGFSQTILILSLSVLPLSLHAQVLHKTFGFNAQETEPEMGLASNTVTDIVNTTNALWFGTGRGLSKTEDDGLTFLSFGTDQGLGRGGVSAIDVSDEVVWVATGFDSLTDFGSMQTGGGLAYSLDLGATWNFVEQPGGTPVSNITFDIALRGEEVWITSFGGGLRKSTDLGVTWEIVTPDSFLFDPLGQLNHRAFSVINADGTLWVGTAGGINRSTDGGATWTNFNHQNQDSPISGNFVVALAQQLFGGREIIWAGTRETTVESGDTTEFRGVSWSDDQGFSWRTSLRGETVHNIAFDDSAVYAASNKGLFKSNDFGETWLLFPNIEDPTGTLRILANEVFDAEVVAGHTLWAGTANGLGKTRDNGATWQIFQVFPPTGEDGEPRTYAYPNPFSPSVHNQLNGLGHVRFQYNTIGQTRITLKIYDFAMQHVFTVVDNEARPANGDFYETWNGLNGRGEQVDNGVYFYRIELEGDGAFWGKLIVLN